LTAAVVISSSSSRCCRMLHSSRCCSLNTSSASCRSWPAHDSRHAHVSSCCQRARNTCVQVYSSQVRCWCRPAQANTHSVAQRCQTAACVAWPARRTCDLHDLVPVAHVDGLVRQGLEEGQHLQEVVDGVPAVHVGLPVPQRLGQLPALVLELQHLLAPLLDLLDHVHPEVVAIALDGAHNIRVQPAHTSCTVTEGKRGQDNKCVTDVRGSLEFSCMGACLDAEP
jgi:hypothetical protein